MKKNDKDAGIEFLRKLIENSFYGRNEIPEQICDFQKKFFKSYKYEDVYQMVRDASKDVHNYSHGEIFFGYHYFEKKWRHLKGLWDYLTVLTSRETNVGGRLKAMEDVYDLGKRSVPIISESKYINSNKQIPIISVEPETKAELKERFGYKKNELEESLID